jgi:hypothetical protein
MGGGNCAPPGFDFYELSRRRRAFSTQKNREIVFRSGCIFPTKLLAVANK